MPTLSNTILQTMASRPYFDDYDPSKDFLRILFRPKFSVQTRELNQLQTMVQAQVERHGKHIFKDGSPVTDGQLSLNIQAQSVRILRTFGGSDVALEDFFNTTTQRGVLIVGQTSGAQARVLQYDTRPGETHAVFIIAYLSDATFVAGETISDGVNSATIAALVDTPFNPASVVSVNEGVYFVAGFFLRVGQQTLVLESFSGAPSYRIGLELIESITTENDDDSLLDPALNTSNYLAPGAHRLVLLLQLTKKTLTGTTPESNAADENFVELLRVVDGVAQVQTVVPEYNELEKTLARRTYDESGNYTVRPFNIQLQDNVGGNTEQLSVGLDPGKAYIKGFEFETIATQFLNVPRARDTEHVDNFDISTIIGNFVIANGVVGSFGIGDNNVIDLHGVSKAGVVYTNNTTYLSTHVATARVRSQVYVSGGVDGATRTYELYLTDVRLKSLTGLANTSNATHIQLGTAGSATDDAYNGARLTLTAGPGAGQTFVITDYTGSTKQAQLTPTTFLGTFTANTTTAFRIDYTFGNVNSLTRPTSAAVITSVANANIAVEGRVGLSPTGQAVLFDSNTNCLVFPIPQSWVRAGSLSDMDYECFRLFSGQQFTTSGSNTVLTLTTTNGTERFYPGFGVPSSSAVLDGYLVVRSSNGQHLSYNTTHIMSVNIPTVANGVPGQVTFTANATNVPNGNTVDVYARIQINQATIRSKNLITANATATGGVSNVSIGQVVIATGANAVGVAISLGIPDCYRLVKVYSTPALGTAPSNTHISPSFDVTSRFAFDSGQRDNMYDYGTITLKPGQAAPTGQLLVMVDYFAHSGGGGFFCVDSYANIAYESIPSYVSPVTGKTYELRDALDFRPTRTANTTQALSEPWYTASNIQIPYPDATFESDYDYYLSRTDKIVLNRNREFKLISGISKVTPIAPPDDPDSMTLYVLRLPPYTANLSQIQTDYIDNKRFTMRDIGRLEKRIQHLEYYTSLSLLEKAARDQTILDANLIERFKNGILVDAFAGHNVGNVLSADYACSIDTNRRELRAPFTSDAARFSYSANLSPGTMRTGDLVTLAYTVATMVSQPLASTFTNINPYQIMNFMGSMTLVPASDVWMDTVTLPDVNVNLFGENDNWQEIGFGTQWDDWETRWTGAEIVSQELLGRQRVYPVDGVLRIETFTQTVTDHTTIQTRQGVATSLVPETITKNLGNRVVDVSINPFMRAANVWFKTAGLKPGSNLTALFDNVDVTPYCERANMLQLQSNVEFPDGSNAGLYDTLTSNTDANTQIRGIGRVIAVRGNYVKVVESDGEFVFANGATALVTGSATGFTANVVAYTHWSGTVANANATHIQLNVGASANNDFYNGLRIYITRGPGSGGYADIDDYNGSTKVATLNVSSSTISTIPTGVSRYSVGPLQSDLLANTSVPLTAGDLHGVFYLPNSDAIRFRAGDRLFRLTDNVNQEVATTSGEAQYHAQGSTQTVEALNVSTRDWVLRRQAVTDERVFTDRTITEDHVAWIDPVAQTFLVDRTLYPSGVYVRSVDLFFRSKDTTGIPVTVQIRPTLNGYPSSSLIVPFGEVVLNTNQVNISNVPSVANAATKTTATFPGLVHLQPGEYAICILSNSLEYEVYVAEIGAPLLNSTARISEQPYAGVLFKSQNSSTWTAIQEQDLMFQVNRAVFTTNAIATVALTADAPVANAEYDVFNVQTGHLDYPGTTSTFTFQLANTNGALLTPVAFLPNQDAELTQRAKLVANGNTFIVRASIQSTDDAVSPSFDMERAYLIYVTNIIGNGGLIANGFVLLPGDRSGHPSSANVALTITSVTGAGANVFATTNSTGFLTGTFVVNDPGSGYTTTPTQVTGNSSGNGVFVYVGETSPSGGNGLAKYITRAVTLSDGFDASDLQVYFTAYKPSGTSIDVYYKVLAGDDAESFQQKSWTLMTQVTNALIFSGNQNDFKEYRYGTVADGAGYTSNGVTYPRFKTFAIKIVMRSTTTTLVPRLRDLRVIALDE